MNNGRRAILAVEKGAPGDKAFADAFAAWQQYAMPCVRGRVSRAFTLLTR